jgi:hypothetical protein
MTSGPVRHPGPTLCAGIIIRRDFRALLERTNPEERRASGPSWIHFRAQDVRNPLVERPFNWFKSPLGHNILPSQRAHRQPLRWSLLTIANRRPEQRRNLLRRVLVQPRNNVAVGVERDADVGVAQPLLDHLGMHTSL